MCRRCKKHDGDGSDTAVSVATLSSGATRTISPSLPVKTTPVELPSEKKSVRTSSSPSVSIEPSVGCNTGTESPSPTGYGC
ncbi:hypothetical protein PISMIDRAFT_674786 [Pisolithus microcarpus 441]|uniref:Uncharacterized protein n=1 Tax=Pisolithus microcarpus 441 TaxID=765257 RepID=A0A0C9ZND2_9AGAM|nr:hypothetical protein PISMIDRAFT_674786 [Pisolithus microcarpus 441]